MKLTKAAFVSIITAACGDYHSDVFGQIDSEIPGGILLAKNGLDVADIDVSAVVAHTRGLWTTALEEHNVNCDIDYYGLVISFKPSPIEIQWGNGVLLFNGLFQNLETIWEDKYQVISIHFNDDWKRYLAHELGHETLFVCGLNYFESNFVEWSKYGVPY